MAHHVIKIDGGIVNPVATISCGDTIELIDEVKNTHANAVAVVGHSCSKCPMLGRRICQCYWLNEVDNIRYAACQSLESVNDPNSPDIRFEAV